SVAQSSSSPFSFPPSSVAVRYLYHLHPAQELLPSGTGKPAFVGSGRTFESYPHKRNGPAARREGDRCGEDVMNHTEARRGRTFAWQLVTIACLAFAGVGCQQTVAPPAADQLQPTKAGAVPGPDPAYVRWLEEHSMLAQARLQAATIS